jgi:hypothetical protein
MIIFSNINIGGVKGIKATRRCRILNRLVIIDVRSDSSRRYRKVLRYGTKNLILRTEGDITRTNRSMFCPC